MSKTMKMYNGGEGPPVQRGTLRSTILVLFAVLHCTMFWGGDPPPLREGGYDGRAQTGGHHSHCETWSARGTEGTGLRGRARAVARDKTPAWHKTECATLGPSTRGLQPGAAPGL